VFVESFEAGFVSFRGRRLLKQPEAAEAGRRLGKNSGRTLNTRGVAADIKGGA
jgi:hypothetical protein